ncbi:uncharacterized protein Z519_06669 [Cladophialophora bantiana CBS 173.52]|uniref:Uncharacterized protein n=1 Tax=Cladophialophora bantiana (strain ATCC 10958 / CBS 173.52 / CDC B-1940 / NIH 8579) TaxID=1442370 RepID=A0A0D2HPN9_CLAB1|nr:uncharacterized protein Z519_06669 [Cladophialophora bantiana CBS 173.52]KIW92820.1 hypothetical protein Z519_06669 [Cladophialophora bantiana CBS 173.52]
MESGYATASLSPDPAAVPASEAPHDNEWYNQDFDGYRIKEQLLYTKRRVRMVIVGAGASGLMIAHKAEHFLQNVEWQIYEKNDDIGGTWLENRYPGCQCDIPSHSYQFSWFRNPKWSQFYSDSPEIWRYFKDMATHFDLEKYVKFNHKVEEARWDEEAGQWILTIAGPNGEKLEDRCEILANNSGILNEWKYPDIPGLDTFKGKLLHTARWDDSYDMKGKVVAVIGGGSSAVQVIPALQKQCKNLVAFLRSPVWITTGFGAKFAGPGGTNFKYSTEQIKKFDEDPATYNEYCRALEGELNKRFTLNHTASADQKASRELIANMMRDKLKSDTLADHLVPGFALGCRRMTPGTGYLESLTASNMTVVKEAAIRLTEDGIVDKSGNEYKVDAVVCATGFTTDFAPHFKVVGRQGREIHEDFGDFPKAYMAVMAEGFPNLFLFLGPNAPASHSSILPILEWHARYMFQMITKMQEEGIKAYDPKRECIKDFYNHTHELMKRLTWSAPCSSWFKNGKIHGPVTAIWPGSRLHYFECMKNPRYEDYNITYQGRNRYEYMGNGYTQVETDPNGNAVWYFDDPFSLI